MVLNIRGNIFFKMSKSVKNENGTKKLQHLEKNRSKNNEKLKKKIFFFNTLKNAPWPKKKSPKFRDPYKSLVPKLVPFKFFTCTCFFILLEFITDAFNLFSHKICHSFIISFGHFIPFGQSFLTGKCLWISIYPSYVPTLEKT